MPTNDFKALAIGGSANVLSQADYIALTALLANGFQSGEVLSPQFNKVLRQSSFVAAGLAQAVSDILNADVLDNGDQAAFKAQIKAMLQALVGSSFYGGTAGGSSNALTGTLSPVPAAYVTGAVYWLKIATTNIAGGVTVNFNSLGAKAAVRNEDGSALAYGDLPAGEIAPFLYDGTSLRLLNLPSIGVRGWRNHQVFNTSGTFNVPAGVTLVYVKVVAGGGGGGGCKTASTTGCGGGGGEGGGAEGFVAVTPVAAISVTVGAAGVAGINTGANAAACNGGGGGTSSFGTAISCTGGSGGGGAQNTTGAGGSPGVPSGGSVEVVTRGVQGSPGYTPDAGGGGRGGDGGGIGGGRGGNGLGTTAWLAGGGGAGGGLNVAGATGATGQIEVFW